MQGLLQSIRLDADADQAFTEAWTQQEVPKGYSLVQPGSLCRYLYFIERGLTRTFYIKDGKDVTDWISTDGTFAVSIVSFLTGTSDIRGIETLEASVLWAISRDTLERLYTQYPAIERFGRILMSEGIVQMQRRFDDLHFTTAAERYRRLMKTAPQILQRVPLGMVASYLGMAPETLSRIRAGGF
jgi:CRP-like cAMP-binding protein